MPLEPFRANLAQIQVGAPYPGIQSFSKRCGFKTTCKNGGSSILERNRSRQQPQVAMFRVTKSVPYTYTLHALRAEG